METKAWRGDTIRRYSTFEYKADSNGNMLVGGWGNLSGGGRAIIGGFVLSTATSRVLPAADGARERLDASFRVVVPEDIEDSIED